MVTHMFPMWREDNEYSRLSTSPHNRNKVHGLPTVGNILEHDSRYQTEDN